MPATSSRIWRMQASIWSISPLWPLSSDSSTRERVKRLLPLLSRAPRLHLAGNELVACDLCDVVEILQNRSQFAAKRDPAFDQVRRGLQQALVGDNLACGREQQRGYRLAAAHA